MIPQILVQFGIFVRVAVPVGRADETARVQKDAVARLKLHFFFFEIRVAEHAAAEPLRVEDLKAVGAAQHGTRVGGIHKFQPKRFEIEDAEKSRHELILQRCVGDLLVQFFHNHLWREFVLPEGVEPHLGDGRDQCCGQAEPGDVGNKDPQTIIAHVEDVVEIAPDAFARQIVDGKADIINLRQGQRKKKPLKLLGDLVLLFSDAFVEACDSSGELLGADGLLTVIHNLEKVPPENFIAALMDAIKPQSPDNLLDDDATVMLIRATGTRPSILNNLLAPFRLFRRARDRTAFSS